MREDYKKARAMALEAVKKAEKEGKSPYLPVLDSMEEVKQSAGQTNLGILELPLNRIKGNKEISRNNAFANNFMPLLEEGTEFAAKWSTLYDSYVNEGIRDAIKVYEYMNRYYVQEGNKRVSVANFGETEFLAAEVIRILPKKTHDRKSLVYFEYLDFYKSTKNFLIVFSKPNSYRRLADLLDQTLGEPWPEDLCRDLKSAFFRFSRCLKNHMKEDDEYVQSDAFLMYITLYPWQSLLETTDDLIIKNITRAKDDLLSSGAVESMSFLDSADTDDKKDSGFWDFFNKPKKYTAQNPLKVGFVYAKNIDDSRWSDSHESGRLYVDETMGDNVRTTAYFLPDHADLKETIHHANHDKCDIVFTTSPTMLLETLRAAVEFPQTKYLNCSIGYNVSSVRCYEGKLYEGTFLMGVLAATQLHQQKSGTRRIGYLSRVCDSRRYVNLNAFAIGVSLIDPSCKVSLISVKPGEDKDFRKTWKEEGVTIYADFEYYSGINMKRAGLYRIGEEQDEYLGAPYYNWGRFYTEIIHSVLVGSWNLREVVEKKKPLSYWFGLSTGLVNIRTKEMPYPTNKMISIMKQGIMNGAFTPFSGEIRSRDGRVIQEAGATRNAELENLTPLTIITMDWLYENIEGEL